MNVCISQRHKRTLQTAAIYPLVLSLLLGLMFYPSEKSFAELREFHKNPIAFRTFYHSLKTIQDTWHTADCYTTTWEPTGRDRSAISTDLFLQQTALFFFQKVKFQILKTNAVIKSSDSGNLNRSLRAPPDACLLTTI